MDTIFIQGLAIDTVIGVYDWEKNIKQRLIFDLEMAWDIREAAQTDDLSKTLDYAQIAIDIEVFANKKPVELLETLAENLAQHLINQYQITQLTMTIHKPDAVANAQSVGVKIMRSNQV